ncbi:MAG: glycosyltransferase family 2 protein [Bacteroidales bacterium]|nr:glycosyltransferase family 2 protein [Bacteroidales bacterium]
MCPEISIIVPVYNTAPYLPRCIDSILNQSFTDFELLLIDDGSFDGSEAICDSYAADDNRIRVFHKRHGGVSFARNIGLDNAKGEWVCFVDSDDELLPDGLKVMVGGISDDVSMVQAGFNKIKDGKLLVNTDVLDIKGEIMDRQQALLMLYQYKGVYMGYPWGRLFNRGFIVEKRISFDERIPIEEDTLFVATYLCQNRKPFYFTSVPVYNYYRISSGTMEALNAVYNPKYLLSFDAGVEMNRMVQALPDLKKELSFLAKKEVVTRCYRIYAHMLKHNSVDKKKVRQLKFNAMGEVGFNYYMDYQFHRCKRRIIKFFQKKEY